MLRKLLGATMLLAILFVAGCGGGDPPPPGTPSAAENLLSLAAIRQLPKGSPEQALLGWWMHIQYNDLTGYLNGLATPLRDAREGEAKTKRDLVLVSGESLRSKPKVLELQRENGKTTLYTRIETRQPVGASRFTTSSAPQAFTLVREGGQWKIADDSYVLDRAGIIREAIENTKPKR
ncbi:MAG TPA: hypothetical protein VGN84_10040 [Solirubrobacterales bacterium]|nr:hypothetical protein [Solirubrobacterales bacterium]